MYQEIKKIIKAIIPRKFLWKYESQFRSIFYLFYKGNRYQCNICKKKLRKFIQINNTDLLCPNCGSISRSRRLWDMLESEFLKEKITVLDFSPSRSRYDILKHNPSITYMSSAYCDNFKSDYKYDITNIDSKNEKFDLIICYHILEHIENDYQAMKELHRILKKDGHCIIQTPFKEGDIDEDPSAKTEEDRLKHFGQEDHVRIYSANGLQERLTNCGFQVTIKEYNAEADNRYGFNDKETVLICKK